MAAEEESLLTAGFAHICFSDPNIINDNVGFGASDVPSELVGRRGTEGVLYDVRLSFFTN